MNEEKNKKILIVEDDPLLRGISEKKLSGAGFNVVGVIDGGEAVKRIKEELPDLILLDIILPNKNGYEILEQIRNGGDATISKIPVLMLSNLGESEDIDKALKAGANGYLIKIQFTSDEIVQEVKKALNMVNK